MIDTVATAESSVPSFTTYVNESAPSKPASGVYSTDAESVFGLPSEQGLSVTGPKPPLAGASTIVNVVDPSLLLATSLTYAVAQDVEASLGAWTSFGSRPSFDGLLPRLGSEFGTNPHVFFLQLAAYF